MADDAAVAEEEETAAPTHSVPAWSPPTETEAEDTTPEAAVPAPAGAAAATVTPRKKPMKVEDAGAVVVNKRLVRCRHRGCCCCVVGNAWLGRAQVFLTRMGVSAFAVGLLWLTTLRMAIDIAQVAERGVSVCPTFSHVCISMHAHACALALCALRSAQMVFPAPSLNECYRSWDIVIDVGTSERAAFKVVATAPHAWFVVHTLATGTGVR